MSGFDRVVYNMMARYGGVAKLISPLEGVYDVDTSSYTTAEAEYTVKAMIFDLTLQSNGTAMMPKSLIEAGDKQVFIQPLNKTDTSLSMPAIRPEKDFIEVSGVRYRIITLKELNPSQTDSILLELYVRK